MKSTSSLVSGVAGQVHLAASSYIAPEHTFKNKLKRGAEVQQQFPMRHLKIQSQDGQLYRPTAGINVGQPGWLQNLKKRNYYLQQYFFKKNSPA